MTGSHHRHSAQQQRLPLLDDMDIAMRPMFPPGAPAEALSPSDRIAAVDEVNTIDEDEDLAAVTRLSTPVLHQNVRHQPTLLAEELKHAASAPPSATSTLFSPTSPLSPTSKKKVEHHHHQQRSYQRSHGKELEEDLSHLSTYEAWKARTVMALQKADKVRWTKCMLGYMTGSFILYDYERCSDAFIFSGFSCALQADFIANVPRFCRLTGRHYLSWKLCHHVWRSDRGGRDGGDYWSGAV